MKIYCVAVLMNNGKAFPIDFEPQTFEEAEHDAMMLNNDEQKRNSGKAARYVVAVL